MFGFLGARQERKGGSADSAGPDTRYRRASVCYNTQEALKSLSARCALQTSEIGPGAGYLAGIRTTQLYNDLSNLYA